MKQIVQNMRTGRMAVAEVPAPALRGPGALVRTRCSLISAGTEKMNIDLARKSLLGKARQRPDLARQFIDKVKRDGLRSALSTAMARLDQPLLQGYSSAGEVIALTGDVPGISVGARVGLPFTSALVLERGAAERVLLLVDHRPGVRLPVVADETLSVRYVTRRSAEGPGASLRLEGPLGDLRYVAVVRPPGSRPFPVETELPAGLLAHPTDELVYLEVHREESACMVERAHYAAEVASAPERVPPGSVLDVEEGGRRYRLHVADVARVTRTDCPSHPASFFAYEVFGPLPE